MAQSRKAELRASIKMWSDVAENAKSEMGFWFRRRWDWTLVETKAEAYQYCYDNYKKKKAEYKFAIHRVAKWTAKYLKEYKHD